MPLNYGNYRLRIPVVKGYCARHTLFLTVSICVFNRGKNKSTIIKHVYNASSNLIESYDVAFDTSDRSYLA